jgi:hypothetical protein
MHARTHAQLSAHVWDVLCVLSEVQVPIGKAVYAMALPLATAVLPAVAAVVRALRARRGGEERGGGRLCAADSGRRRGTSHTHTHTHT